MCDIVVVVECGVFGTRLKVVPTLVPLPSALGSLLLGSDSRAGNPFDSHKATTGSLAGLLTNYSKALKEYLLL